MADAPEAAPEVSQSPVTEAQPTTNEPVAAPTTEVNAEQVAKFFGTDAETLGKFQKFIEANGKFDSAFSKMKTDISNPQKPVVAPQTASAPQNDNQPTSQPNPPVEPQYKAPEGSITAQEFLAQQYFQGLSRDPKYEGIADQIASGGVLKEMAAFNIQALNQDGSINDAMVRRFLDLKAQTVPAKPTDTEPNASAAPTVTYTEVGENGIASIDDAYKILMEPGNPNLSRAEEFIKNHFNPNSSQPAKK